MLMRWLIYPGNRTRLAQMTASPNAFTLNSRRCTRSEEQRAIASRSIALSTYIPCDCILHTLFRHTLTPITRYQALFAGSSPDPVRQVTSTWRGNHLLVRCHAHSVVSRRRRGDYFSFASYRNTLHSGYTSFYRLCFTRDSRERGLRSLSQ